MKNWQYNLNSANSTDFLVEVLTGIAICVIISMVILSFRKENE